MKKTLLPAVGMILLLLTLTGCAPASTPIPFTPTSSPVPPTWTPPPAPPTGTPSPLPPTATSEPTAAPTPIPGLVVFPVDTLGEDIPWLPLDSSNRPAVNYVSFNNLLPPFNNTLVRQAFAHAIDRQALVEMVRKYYTKDPKPATSFTPPETLGRDVYNQVGAGFDPQKARDLLSEAGYSDTSAFPDVTMLVNAYGDVAPGARFNMANAMAEMWQTNLGVTVQVEVIPAFKDYSARISTNPPGIFWQGWVADVNDPDNFMREVFHSTSQYNHGQYNNPEYDQLVEKAAQSKDPAERQELYIQAERILNEADAALIPLYHYTHIVQ